MSRPTTKSDLIQSANKQFETLFIMINSMSNQKQNEKFLFDDRDKNLRDVLIHLYEWHKMVESWHQIGTIEKGTTHVPGKGYSWRTLPDLNLEIWKKHQHISLASAKQMLKESHQSIMKRIELHSNDELFSKTIYKWTKSSTLGAYFVGCTSSHYDWAMKKIKLHIKSYRAAN